MASSRGGKGKKVVSQEELRRLMKEKQKESSDKKKRIESPFAKYNSVGHLLCVLCNVPVKTELLWQWYNSVGHLLCVLCNVPVKTELLWQWYNSVGHLLCVLCNVPVKTELLWQAHILGKQHKEKVAELKEAKQVGIAGVSQIPSSSAVKRRTSDAENPDVKRSRGNTDSVPVSGSGLPADFFDTGEALKPTVSKQPSGLGFLAGNYDDGDDEGDGGKNGEVTEAKLNVPPAAAPGLPADFFDSSIPSALTISHSGSILKADEPEKSVDRKENTAEALPEGFFDDPVTDAKVRKVDAPKDLMDKEWEEFQKEIRHVNNASEAIVAEEDEDGRLERQIDEIDQQIECFRRVELLRDKRDMVKKMLQRQESSHLQEDHGTEDEEEDKEEELLNLLSRDWRAKGALA